MKHFYAYLGGVLLVYLALFCINFFNINMFDVKKSELLGSYRLNVDKNYILVLNANNTFILFKTNHKQKNIKIKGEWTMLYEFNLQKIKVAAKGCDSLCFSLGEIRKNYLNNDIMIEALFAYKFMGKEDNAWFIKE